MSNTLYNKKFAKKNKQNSKVGQYKKACIPHVTNFTLKLPFLPWLTKDNKGEESSPFVIECCGM